MKKQVRSHQKQQTTFVTSTNYWYCLQLEIYLLRKFEIYSIVSNNNYPIVLLLFVSMEAEESLSRRCVHQSCAPKFYQQITTTNDNNSISKDHVFSNTQMCRISWYDHLYCTCNIMPSPERVREHHYLVAVLKGRERCDLRNSFFTPFLHLSKLSH
jgi:hypothetical protein